MALIFGETGEHAVALGAPVITGGGGATTQLTNRRIWDAQTSGNSLAYETTTVPPGARACFKIPNVAVAANISRSFSDNTGCFGFWFRKIGATNPSAVNPRIVGLNPSNHIVRLSSGGVLQIAAANAGPQTIITPTADTWYWITVKFDTSGGTHTLDAKVYSDTGTLLGTATQSTAVLAAAAQTSFILGTGGSMGGASCFVGTMVLDDDPANYPILPMGSALLAPTASGAHSFTAGDFKDNTGATLLSSETTSWALLDEKPPNTTDWVRQEVDNANGYMEYQHEDTPTGLSLGQVSFVQLIAAQLPDGTGANLTNVHLNDGGTISGETNYDASLTANTLEYHMHGYTVRPNGGGAWSTAAADALRSRVGYMTLQPAFAGFSAVFIQVFAPLSFGGGSVIQGGALAVPAATAVTVGSGRVGFKSGVVASAAASAATVANSHLGRKSGALSSTQTTVVTVGAGRLVNQGGALAVGASTGAFVADQHVAYKSGAVDVSAVGEVLVFTRATIQGGSLSVAGLGSIDLGEGHVETPVIVFVPPEEPGTVWYEDKGGTRAARRPRGLPYRRGW